MDGLNRARGIAAGLALLLSAGAAEAGVTYVDQQRVIDVLTPDDVILDREVATAYGPFAGEASYEDRSGPRERARATQTSDVGDGFVRASGEVSGRSEADPVRFRSRLVVTFVVDAPTPYTLNASLAGTATGPAPQPGGRSVFTASLFQGTVSGRPAPSDEAGIRVTEEEFRQGNNRPELSAAGTLQPGSYRLALEVQGRADGVPADNQTFDPAEMQASYALDFRIGDAAGPGPGSGPAPAAPLPPAGWARSADARRHGRRPAPGCQAGFVGPRIYRVAAARRIGSAADASFAPR